VTPTFFTPKFISPRDSTDDSPRNMRYHPLLILFLMLWLSPMSSALHIHRPLMCSRREVLRPLRVDRTLNLSPKIIKRANRSQNADIPTDMNSLSLPEILAFRGPRQQQQQLPIAIVSRDPTPIPPQPPSPPLPPIPRSADRTIYVNYRRRLGKPYRAICARIRPGHDESVAFGENLEFRTSSSSLSYLPKTCVNVFNAAFLSSAMLLPWI